MTVLIIAISMFACDLDEKPYSFSNRSNYYTNQIEIENGVIGVYDVFGEFISSLGYMDALTVMCGDGIGGQLQNFNQHTFDAENEFVEKAYTLCYKGINRANEVLAFVDEVYFDTDVNRNKAKGEALFVRGYYYLYLASYFGDVPKRTTPSISPDPIPKSPASEIIAQAVSDLKDAKELLPTRAAVASYLPGKPVSETASALLSKAYLYAGEYRLAKTEAKSVIDGGVFGWITGNYNLIWLTTNETSKEFVYSIQVSTAISNNWLTDFMVAESDHPYGKGNHRVTFVDDFLNTFDPSDTRFNWYKKEYTTAQSVVKSTSVGKAEKFITLTGQTGLDTWTKGINYPLMRFSDLVLVYAEAAARDNEIGNGLLWINKLRHRAFNVDIETANASIDRPATTDINTVVGYILQERLWEFGGEGIVWPDLTRTGEFKKPVYSGNSNTLPDKYRYLPIPYAEVVSSQNVVEQNPEWR
jgi:hypothetical protein